MTHPILATIAAFVLTLPLCAQDAPVAEARTVDAAIEAVTVYRGRAAVSRRTTETLDAGLFALQFTALPEAVQPETIQARADGAARIVGVEFRTRAVDASANPRIRELDVAITAAERALAAIAEDREMLARDEALFDTVARRIARGTDDDKDVPAPFDLDTLREQLAYVGTERVRLLEARRALAANERTQQEALRLLRAERDQIAGRTRTERFAEVSLVALSPGDVTVELVYLVNQATWEPAYNIRADAAGASVAIEYDAFVSQRTGEDWTDVALTLSTAQPARAANPPELSPWYVDLQAPVFASASAPPPGAAAGSEAMGRGRSKARRGQALEEMAADAEVGGTGPSVTYAIPRRLTIASDRRERQRTRIATVETTPEYVHAAVPMLTDAVYIRGSFNNTSVYTLLPGRASIFVGQDFVGPTRLDTVAPGAPIELYFGIDPAVTATRTLVEKTSSKTGLLGGGRKTVYAYRLEIANDAGKPIQVELTDRIPVSRNEQIEIELVNLSHALDTDPAYLEDERLQGILKWQLTVPPRATNPWPLTYGVNLTRGKDVAMTPLPE